MPEPTPAEKIMELQREVWRLEHAAKSSFRERLALLVVNGTIMIGMAWVQGETRVAKADQGLAKEVVKVERDRAVARADELYDTAETIYVQASDEGCEVH